MLIIEKILTPLTKLCNLSFTVGVFPAKMKTAKITPIFKSGDKTLPKNYRPISVLPYLSKVLESLFLKRVQHFLEEHAILNNNQYGFLPNRSTNYAAIDFYEHVTTLLKNKYAVISLSLDLSKAFDSISHDILLQKAYFYGIRGGSATGG